MMPNMFWLMGSFVCGLLLLTLTRWWVSQRLALRLRRCQESPSVYASFDMLKGVEASDIQILSRPGAWPRKRWAVIVPKQESWYCHASRIGYFCVTAEYRRAWWGWRVTWQVALLDESAMRRSLAKDVRAYRLAFGHQVAERLYA